MRMAKKATTGTTPVARIVIAASAIVPAASEISPINSTLAVASVATIAMTHAIAPVQSPTRPNRNARCAVRLKIQNPTAARAVAADTSNSTVQETPNIVSNRPATLISPRTIKKSRMLSLAPSSRPHFIRHTELGQPRSTFIPDTNAGHSQRSFGLRFWTLPPSRSLRPS